MAMQKRKLRGVGAGVRKDVFEGIFAFTTTGLTKDVVLPFNRVESVFVKPTGTPAKSYRTITHRIGAVTATASHALILPPYAGTLIAAKITVDTTHATHNDNHWSFTLVNKGAAGSGTTDMILANGANSTDADSTPAGAAITAFIARSLSLHGTAANLAFAAGDVVALVATKAASATSLSGLILELTVDVGDPAEMLTVNKTVSGTAGEDDCVMLGSGGQTTVTITRNATNPTSGLKFSLLAIGT
jgi:hypothetical protein